MPSHTNALVGNRPKLSRDQRERTSFLTCVGASRLALWLFPALLSAGTVSPPASVSPVTGFAVLSDDPGSWPQILSAVGFQPQTAAAAGIVVLRPGSAAVSQLTERVDQGAFAIVEGASTSAEVFGFRAGKDHVIVGSVEDVHRPKLPVIWQKSVELPRFEVPKSARIFAKERWTGAPLIAGYTSGRGAVLWVAADPGERGLRTVPVYHASVERSRFESHTPFGAPLGVL